MKRVVIDTNVIISAMLSPTGSPAKIMQLVYCGELLICYSEAIVDEYIRVLAYKKFSFPDQAIEKLLDTIHRLGMQYDPANSNIQLIDEDDRTFYDTSKESKSILITGNVKHYPVETFIMSPAAFLGAYNAVVENSL